VPNGESEPRTAETILEILRGAAFARLLGVAEDVTLDFKGEPYDLGSETGKFELAKDVVAMANSGVAGVVVVGVETEVRPESPFEHASRIRPVPLERVDLEQYRRLIRERAYPAPRGLAVNSFPSTEDPSKALIAIHVPAQRDDDRPFLVMSPIGSEGQKVQGWLVGLPTRALEQTEHMRAAELHGLLVRGQALVPRLEELAAQIGSLRAPAIAANEADRLDDDDNRSRSLTQTESTRSGTGSAIHATLGSPSSLGSQMPWSELSTLQLAARPPTRVSLPTFFAREGVRTALEQPRFTREDGWNLRTLDEAKLVGGGTRLRVQSGSRKLIELHEDGTLVAVANFGSLLTVNAGGSPAFGEQPGTAPLKVNPMALIEFTHDFVLAYVDIARQFHPPPSAAEFTVAVRLTEDDRARIHLPAHGVDTYSWVLADDPEFPDVATMTFTVERRLEANAIPETAFELVRRVYAFFSRTTDAIPYLTADRHSVDPSQFGRS
jgi:hypothetical protein